MVSRQVFISFVELASEAVDGFLEGQRDFVAQLGSREDASKPK